MSEPADPSALPGDQGVLPHTQPAPPSRPLSRLRDVSFAALAFLLYLLILDVAAETFLSGSPIRRVVAGVIGGYVLLSTLLWRRLRWATRVGLSYLILLGLIALTAWLPTGLTSGVILLRQPTAAVLSGVTALTILVAGIVLLGLRSVPKSVRVPLAVLAGYGVVAFALAANARVPYAQLFGGQSTWQPLPFWLQGAFIGAFVFFPLALVLIIIHGFARVRGAHLRRWAVQVLAPVLGLAIASAGFRAAFNRRFGGAAPAAREGKPAPALRLTVELPWGQPYPGDPLRVRIGLSSPRAMQQAHLLALELEREKSVSAPAFTPPPIASPDWSSRLAFRLEKILPDGSRQEALSNANWQSFLSRKTEGRPARRLGVAALVEEWIVPPAVFGQLGEGTFSLEVAWTGKDVVDASLLDREGKLRAAPVTFEVKSPADDPESAAHLERVAFFEYSERHYEEARRLGQSALRLDPDGFSPQRAWTFLLIADSSFQLGDPDAAAQTYRALLKKLPPPDRSDLALAVVQRLETLQKGSATH